jgi:cytoskeletal protein RodZ
MKRIFGITGGLLLATLILATFLTHIHSSSTVNLKNTSLNHQQSNDNSKSSDKTNNSTTSNNTSSLTNQQAQLQQSEAQYQQDKALAQEYQNQANQDALNAQNSANVNSSTNWNSNTSTTNSSPQPQSWDCNSSLYTGFTGPYTINSISVDLNCNSSSGGTNELSCSGDISTMLTSQSYPYAQLQMTCST